MGLYSRHIFPRLMDWVMSGQAFQRLRADLLQDSSGEVLEIGFGTGLNLVHYPASVSRLSVVDPADLLPHRVSERIAMVTFPVRTTQVTAEALPYPDRQFDRVVSTWMSPKSRATCIGDERYLFLRVSRQAVRTTA